MTRLPKLPETMKLYETIHISRDEGTSIAAVSIHSAVDAKYKRPLRLCYIRCVRPYHAIIINPFITPLRLCDVVHPGEQASITAFKSTSCSASGICSYHISLSLVVLLDSFFNAVEAARSAGLVQVKLGRFFLISNGTSSVDVFFEEWVRLDHFELGFVVFGVVGEGV